MTHPLDGPQEDARWPGYGAWPSFGMLGPSRVVLRFGGLPVGFEQYADGVCLGYKTEGFVSPPWFAQWQCIRSDATFNLFLSWLTPQTGLYRMSVDINATPPSASGGATRLVNNFTWQFPPVVLTDDLTPWGSIAVYRVGEWQTVTERFPSVLFPE